MGGPELREDFARDVVLLKYVGLNPIVVHGGGPEITRYMEALDLPGGVLRGLRGPGCDATWRRSTCRWSSSAVCGSPTRRRSRWRRWSSSARSTRTSCCAST